MKWIDPNKRKPKYLTEVLVLVQSQFNGCYVSIRYRSKPCRALQDEHGFVLLDTHERIIAWCSIPKHEKYDPKME